MREGKEQAEEELLFFSSCWLHTSALHYNFICPDSSFLRTRALKLPSTLITKTDASPPLLPYPLKNFENKRS